MLRSTRFTTFPLLASDLDWGAVAQFFTALQEQLLRLGGWPDNSTAATAIEILAQQIKWTLLLLSGPNSRDQNTPLVYNVDHETMNEAPHNRQVTTITEFLSLLAAAPQKVCTGVAGPGRI